MPSKWPDKRTQATCMCQNLNAIKANDACPPCGASVLLYFPALKYSKGNVQIPQTWSEIFPEMTLALKKKKNSSLAFLTLELLANL